MLGGRAGCWFVAVVAVNLVTHPALVFIVDAFGRSPLVVLPCEATVICVEAFLFMLAYGFVRWRLLMALSSLVNGASYVIGMLLRWVAKRGWKHHFAVTRKEIAGF